MMHLRDIERTAIVASMHLSRIRPDSLPKELAVELGMAITKCTRAQHLAQELGDLMVDLHEAYNEITSTPHEYISSPVDDDTESI